MKIKLGFGITEQEVELPQKNILEILIPSQVEYGLTGEEEVRQSLEHPIGSKRLREIVKPGETKNKQQQQQNVIFNRSQKEKKD